MDRADSTRFDFGDAFAQLRALQRDDEDMPQICDRVVRLAERMGEILRDARHQQRASRGRRRFGTEGAAE